MRRRWQVLLLLLSATACAHRDHYPMRNPATGEEVTCYTPYYSFGLPEMRTAEQCIHACERYGFEYQRSNQYYKPAPKAPDEDVKPYVPAACLP
jgi:hypothetical protein